ncbi:hypothetical protein ABPG72_013375 [Tetrahymena utriculariae]
MSGALAAVKIASMATMFFLTLIMGSIPLRSKSFKENQLVISLSSAFSGGLFLAVGLLHLLPDATESFENYYTSTTTYTLANQNTDTASSNSSSNASSSSDSSSDQNTVDCDTTQAHFPFHMFITAISFSLILMIEKVIGSKYHDMLHSDHHHDHNHNHDHGQTENKKADIECNQHKQQVNSEQSQKSSKIAPYKEVEKVQFVEENTSPIISIQRNCENQYSQRKDETMQNETINKTSLQGDLSPGTSMMMALKLNIEQSGVTDSVKDEISYMGPKKGVESLINQVSNRIQQNQNIQSDKQEFQINIVNQQVPDNQIPPSQQRKIGVIRQASKELDKIQKNQKVSITPIIIQLAFGIHATLEGLAIGVQDNLGLCLTISLAVICHKWAEGLVVGIALKKTGIPVNRATFMIALQGTMNPFGIGLGWVLSDAGDLVSGILVSISAGTFLYIATIEVIVEEFNLERYKIIKFILFLVAIGFISSLWAVQQATGAG